MRALATARPIRLLSPDAEELEGFVAAHGSNAFYDSIELRKRCCEIRKLRPLRRALQGKRLWITGLRREQSVTRADIAVLAHDDANGLMKLNPLADWTDAQVWEYVRRFDVPTNALHQRGFPSIGCAPCTRAVQPGEDPRSGPLVVGAGRVARMRAARRCARTSGAFGNRADLKVKA